MIRPRGKVYLSTQKRAAQIFSLMLDKKAFCFDHYLRTKHGTISPLSILLSHDEHTPW